MPFVPSLFSSNSHSKSSLNIYYVWGPESSGGEHDRCGGPGAEGGHKLKEEERKKKDHIHGRDHQGQKDAQQTMKGQNVGTTCAKARQECWCQGWPNKARWVRRQKDRQERSSGQRELLNTSELMKTLTRETDQTSTSYNTEPSNPVSTP